MDGDEQNDPPSIPPKNHVIHLPLPPPPPPPPPPPLGPTINNDLSMVTQIFSFSHTRD